MSNLFTPFERMRGIAQTDVTELEEAGKSYGDSWKRRGGVGAFMMLARKWDRIENQVLSYNYDVFEAYHDDDREEGILDDIKDLRRYLLLVEEHVTSAETRMRKKENEE
jgi:hypothetical protein|tara:strand:- start:305 stop:631 length:327 start_codon:yes stop_codon:yes gene_type:complete